MSEEFQMSLGEIQDEGAGAPLPISDMLNKVLANPQIITAVASALSGVKPSGENSPQTKPAEPDDGFANDIQDKMPDVAKMVGSLLSSSNSSQNDKRSCLLRAIKPYVSHQRAEAIDYMIKFSRLSEILKGMN